MNSYMDTIKEISKLIESKECFNQRKSKEVLEEIIEINANINKEFKILKDKLVSKTISNGKVKELGLYIAKELDEKSKYEALNGDYKEAYILKEKSCAVLENITEGKFECIEDICKLIKEYSITVGLFD